MSGEQFSVGTRVTYDDEPLDHPEACGIIVAPTAEELEYAKTYSDPVGPEHGDVLVQWDEDDELDRSWERPATCNDSPSPWRSPHERSGPREVDQGRVRRLRQAARPSRER